MISAKAQLAQKLYHTTALAPDNRANYSYEWTIVSVMINRAMIRLAVDTGLKKQ